MVVKVLTCSGWRAAPSTLGIWGRPRWRFFFTRPRVGDRRLETAPDGLALAVDRLDVTLLDLFLEESVGHCNRRFGARYENPHEPVVGEQDDNEPQPSLTRRHLRLSGSFRGLPTVGRLNASGGRGITVPLRLLSGRLMVTSSSAIATEIFAVVGDDYHLRHRATRSLLSERAQTERNGYSHGQLRIAAIGEPGNRRLGSAPSSTGCSPTPRSVKRPRLSFFRQSTN